MIDTWQITGRHLVDPPPADWRLSLAERLNGRPRRVGAWVELVLFGALACLDDSGEARLPSGARLNLSTVHGPDIAFRAALCEAHDDPPLPIGFMAGQPAQALPALASHLGWRGDGRCLTGRDPLVLLRYLCQEASLDPGSAGMLAGWVDEDDAGTCRWLRLVPVPVGASATPPARSLPYTWLPLASISELTDRSLDRVTLRGRQLLAGRPTRDPLPESDCHHA